MAIQPLVKHGVHPDRAHDGLAWIVIAATFAKVVRPEDAALELHGLLENTVWINSIISPGPDAIRPRFHATIRKACDAGRPLLPILSGFAGAL